MPKNKYFLVYIDILGFVERAKKDTEKSTLTAEEARKIYNDRITPKLDILKASNAVKDYHKWSPDSWLLLNEDIWNAFKSVGELLKTELDFEVAIGVKEFDESPVSEELIFLRNETMDYIKRAILNILSPYEKWYKDKYGESVKQTFVLLTQEAYKELESKKGMACKPYDSADFYLLEQEKFFNNLKVFDFLQKIDTKREEYREIEKLYVEPENYNEIVEKLNNYKIVFIIGDAEIGKTYTAVKLLFDFYKNGYEPQYIPEEDRNKQWRFIRHECEFEGKAVYLEDPWGKAKFLTAESIFREIGNLILNVRNQNCRIIITSREKVFTEFEKRKTTAEDLWLYVSNLKINLAYSSEKFLKMMQNHIDVFEPKWNKNRELIQMAFRAVGKELKTPMSISRMIEYTKDALDEDSLMDGILKASIETKLEFASEIKEMFKKGRYDKIVFLSLPFVVVEIETAKTAYKSCLEDLGYNLMMDDFETLLKDFKEVEPLPGRGRLRFIHQSYWEGFSYALIDGDNLNNIFKKIFFKVSISLAKAGEIAPLIYVVSPAFDELLRNDKSSLDVVIESFLRYASALEENGITARNSAEWLSDNTDWIFDVISDHIRGYKPRVRYLPKTLTKWVVITRVNYIADKLRDDIAQKYADAGRGVRAIVENLELHNQSTREIQIWLFKIADIFEGTGKAVREIAEKLWLNLWISDKMISEFAEMYEVAGQNARVLAENADFYMIDNPPFRIDEKFKDLNDYLVVIGKWEVFARTAITYLDQTPVEIKIKIIELISSAISGGPSKDYRSLAFKISYEILNKLSQDENDDVNTRAEIAMHALTQ